MTCSGGDTGSLRRHAQSQGDAGGQLDVFCTSEKDLQSYGRQGFCSQAEKTGAPWAMFKRMLSGWGHFWRVYICA